MCVLREICCLILPRSPSRSARLPHGRLDPPAPVFRLSGMAKNKRSCPALGRTISGEECGAHRLSRYACPESCPFNPWSQENYDRALEIEDGLRLKTLGWMKEELETRKSNPSRAMPVVSAPSLTTAPLFSSSAEGSISTHSKPGRSSCWGCPCATISKRISTRR